MKPIHTREQLIWEIREIINKHWCPDFDKISLSAAEEITDLIADLGNHCFHSKDQPNNNNNNNSTVL